NSANGTGGGGVYVTNSATRVNIEWSTIAGNSAANGSGADLYIANALSTVVSSSILLEAAVDAGRLEYANTVYGTVDGDFTDGSGNHALQPADILFVGVGDYTDAYRLASGSVAIDYVASSSVTDPPAADLAGNTRPYGSAYDCGAYEYAAAAPAAPAALPYRDAADAAFESLDDDPGFDLF
ncbi:MAG: hypothetical protein K6E55_02355, partial [Thermoguttaceae bacterium]|nr:hypothetical protein [Thermoguttaceae bacterium]